MLFEKGDCPIKIRKYLEIIKEGVDMFRILAILITSLFVLYISSCGQDENPVEIIQENASVNFVSVLPPSGKDNEIAPNTTITLIFDGIPTGVASSAGNLTSYDSKIVVINGPFTPDLLELTVHGQMQLRSCSM